MSDKKPKRRKGKKPPELDNIKIPNRSIEHVNLYDVKMKLKLTEHILKACMNNTIDRKDVARTSFIKKLSTTRRLKT